ncbi:hypothetical protein EDC04DRAFT_3137624 [Pisolithus marmoratus]|nr:hypothetical protein EDC04DRAFT_3137624 [Pisolithus marmoratus]
MVGDVNDPFSASEGSDEEFEWEEVHVPVEQPTDQGLELELSGPSRSIEITLHAQPKKDESKKKAAAALHAQRLLRTTCHKIHTVCLLANARVRNKWINDELLHARLLSMTPMNLQNAFAMIHKSRVPDQNKRGRLFEATVNRLVDWWAGTFFTVVSTGHIRNRTFEEVQQELETKLSASDSFGEDTNETERVRSVNSLMKHALMQRGSRDTGAQLFTALCRALDIPARLVVSLQSVPWRTSVGKQAGLSNKGKAPTSCEDAESGLHDDGDSDMEGKDAPVSFQRDGTGLQSVKGKEKAHPVIKLRKSKSKPSTGRSTLTVVGKSKPSDPRLTPPVFWTEVFSRADSRWLPVDPIRGIVNKRHVFDPSGPQPEEYKVSRIEDNRMLYVVALEEDGFGRDVTARYARDYTAKVSKAQGIGSGPLGGRKEWWARVVQAITRPYRLNRDDVEDDELHIHQLTEGMPTTLAGFKDHPIYVLARHLKRDQVIDPPTELGKFRGEPVYPRSSVISLKTAENWMRQGRTVRPGCQPMKMVKQRAATISRQREMELAIERAKSEGHSTTDGEVMQGLYAFSQTELYMPEPIKNGIIPKNEFGNIDLYVPSMLPGGAVHIPCKWLFLFKGVAKIARKLGFDYAEAMTGFEFKKRRAYPVLEGIVVAAENEGVIVEAYLEAEQDAEERARAKRFDQVCKRWVRLIQGLRIRDRLQKQYGSNPTEDGPKEETRREHWQDTEIPESTVDEPGGFLTTADDVVQPFHLPRNIHQFVLSTGTERSDITTVKTGLSDPRTLIISETVPWSPGWEAPDGIEGMGIVPDNDIAQPTGSTGVVPKTMRELAEHHVQLGKGSRNESLEPASQSQVSHLVNAEKSGIQSGRQFSASASEAPTPTPSTKQTRSSRKKTRARSQSASGDEANVTPPKRARRLDPDVVNNNPTRVLRPRVPKSAAKVQEENEIEKAYRRAVKH